MLLDLRNAEKIDLGIGPRKDSKYSFANVKTKFIEFFFDFSETKSIQRTSHPARSLFKRILDITLASAMLIALLPTLCALAILIRRDGGPIMFRHRRVGADGKSFHCLKFRSMCLDAEAKLKEHLEHNAEAQKEWEQDFKLKHDPRVTRLGSILRRTSLDELPQLLNVLKGDMSLVGPRPIVTDEIARYGNAFDLYIKCRPGITGLWQVSGRNDIDYASRVSLDARYAANWNHMTDFTILVRTFGVVLRRSGAY